MRVLLSLNVASHRSATLATQVEEVALEVFANVECREKRGTIGLLQSRALRDGHADDRVSCTARHLPRDARSNNTAVLLDGGIAVQQHVVFKVLKRAWLSVPHPNGDRV